MSDALFGTSDAGFVRWDDGAFPRAGGIARSRRAIIVAITVLAVCAAVALGFARLPAPPSSVPPESPVTLAPSVAWLAIAKPVQVFSLQANELASLPLAYAARRRADGGEREDTLAFGMLAAGGSALRLRLFRADPAAPVAPLYVALARQAAEAGLSIGRIGLPDLMPTRFGAFEIADIDLTSGRATQAGRPARCSGFRLVNDHPGLTITGLACGAAGIWPRKALACLVDRLDLASGGDDRQLIDYFAATELRRDAACQGMRLAPDTAHARWLDDKPATQRKTLRRR